MEKPLKIAICLSGQARTWKSCYKRWLEIFSPQGDVDFFFHLWDYNTQPSQVISMSPAHNIEDRPISEQEQLELINVLNPKKHIFETRKNIEYWNCKLPVNEQFGSWCREQFYSMYRASILKREYEIEHEFRYDVVIRIRSDLWLIDDHKIIHPAPNVVYTSHCSWDTNYHCYRVGDIFFYADSHTFDQVSEFYKFLSSVPTKWVTATDCPPPEIALYFYLMSIGIPHHPTHVSMKIWRDQEFVDIKGKLDNYETS